MIKRTLIAALAAGSAFAAVTTTSSAEPPLVRFDLQTKTVATQGRARAVGTVQLQSNQYGQWRGVLKGRLNDICPPDRYGAYLEIDVYHSRTGLNRRSAEDVRGCEADAKDVELKTPWDNGPFKVVIRLYEYDAQTGDFAPADAVRVEYSPAQLGA